MSIVLILWLLIIMTTLIIWGIKLIKFIVTKMLYRILFKNMLKYFIYMVVCVFSTVIISNFIESSSSILLLTIMLMTTFIFVSICVFVFKMGVKIYLFVIFPVLPSIIVYLMFQDVTHDCVNMKHYNVNVRNS